MYGPPWRSLMKVTIQPLTVTSIPTCVNRKRAKRCTVAMRRSRLYLAMLLSESSVLSNGCWPISFKQSIADNEDDAIIYISV